MCVLDGSRTERQALFRWLPACNYGVMALTLLYQAPFEAILGHALGPRLVGASLLLLPFSAPPCMFPVSSDLCRPVTPGPLSPAGTSGSLSDEMTCMGSPAAETVWMSPCNEGQAST